MKPTTLTVRTVDSTLMCAHAQGIERRTGACTHTRVYFSEIPALLLVLFVSMAGRLRRSPGTGHRDPVSWKEKRYCEPFFMRVIRASIFMCEFSRPRHETFAPRYPFTLVFGSGLAGGQKGGQGGMDKSLP